MKYFKVVGNSMLSMLCEGNIVELVQKEYRENDIVIAKVKTDDKFIIKRFKNNMLIGDNKKTSHDYFANEVEIIGKAEITENKNLGRNFTDVYADEWDIPGWTKVLWFSDPNGYPQNQYFYASSGDTIKVKVVYTQGTGREGYAIMNPQGQAMFGQAVYSPGEWDNITAMSSGQYTINFTGLNGGIYTKPSIPLIAPSYVTLSNAAPMIGQSYTLSWGGGSGADTYEVTCRWNRNDSLTNFVTSTSSTSCTVILPDYAKDYSTVEYRVTAIKGQPYQMSSLVYSPAYNITKPNSPPTTPQFTSPASAISLKAGSSYTVSWTASTDPDGNFKCYQLFQTLDGVLSCLSADTRATSYAVTIPNGLKVVYQVRAEDSQSVDSTMCTSPTITIINNSPPSTPTQFTLPSSSLTLQGGSTYNLSWAASSDVDSNLAGYFLYQSLNGGTDTQIYLGALTSYTVTIPKGNNTVRYRVHAYDTQGQISGFCYSPIITINNNTPPTISVKDNKDTQIAINSTLFQDSKNDFTFKLTPNDIDTTDTLQYSILFKDVAKVGYTNCTKGTEISYTIPFSQMAYGNNKVTIKVKDNNNTETVFNFYIKNKTPLDISLRTCQEVLKANGIVTPNCTCLQDLKPKNYSSSTLSLSEIINFI